MAVKNKNEDLLEKVETKTSVKKAKKLTDSSVVTVINNFPGLLFYRSPRYNDEFIWSEWGDENEMSLQELKSMKASHRRFFEDKWINFMEEESDDIVKYLKVEKYYKDGVPQEDWDNIFELSVDELSDIIETATPSEKSLILTKAREKYESGELKDIHIINLIQDKLQVDIDINNPK